MKNPFSGFFRQRDKPQNAISAAPIFFFGSSNSVKTVNPKNAVQMSTVYACVRVIAETIACLAELSRKKLWRSQSTSVIYIDSYIYAKRWNIEVFFQSCKQKLAFDKYQLRKKQGITRMWLILSLIHFLCCTVSGCVGSFDEGYNYFRNCVLQEIFAPNAFSA